MVVMAKHIQGPLYYECAGRSGPVMAFLQPNPLDQSCWMYQMAHFSTWFRCIAIDIPGYGRSPKAEPGLTLGDIAAGCWEAIEDAYPGERAVLVGCSVGSQLTPYMFRQQPARPLALILSGVGYNPLKEFAGKAIEAYSKQGIAYRREHILHGFSPAFRTTPTAKYFADLFTQRNDSVDVDSLILQFHAHRMPDPEDLHSRISCPTILISGTEDATHKSAFALKERIPGCELQVLPGGGHVSHLEQPWLFDKFMIDFLAKHGLFPSSAKC
jgi:pimeloyl-ACP methyl ester carboxylesterase